MAKCYFCGGWVELKHEVQVKIDPEGNASTAHEGCYRDYKEDYERIGFKGDNN